MPSGYVVCPRPAESPATPQINGVVASAGPGTYAVDSTSDISNRDIGKRYRVDTPEPYPLGGVVGRNRTGVLEFAVLGLLHRTPMHGYELSKQLNSLLGAFRALSYGTLYPCLNKLYEEGLIAKEGDAPDGTKRSAPLPGPDRPGQAQRRAGRSKIVYRLTAEGKDGRQDLLAAS